MFWDLRAGSLREQRGGTPGKALLRIGSPPASSARTSNHTKVLQNTELEETKRSPSQIWGTFPFTSAFEVGLSCTSAQHRKRTGTENCAAKNPGWAKIRTKKHTGNPKCPYGKQKKPYGFWESTGVCCGCVWRKGIGAFWARPTFFGQWLQILHTKFLPPHKKEPLGL